MTTPIQPPLEAGYLQLTSQHRVEFDKMNVTLTKIYQKRSGKGRAAEFINEWGYGAPCYYSSLPSLLNRLKDKEFMEELSETDTEQVKNVIEAIELASERVEKKLQEVIDHTNKQVIINTDDNKKGRKSTKDTAEEIE